MIKTDIRERVAFVTIDNPGKLNALDTANLLDLDTAVTEANSDPEIGAIVITGAGDKSFVAGGDIGELSQPMGPADALDLPMQRVFDNIAGSAKPTIAAINGYALGGGFELALACDIRIASDTAVLALPELSWSVLPAAGGVTRLTRLVGPGRALDMILTGRKLGATEALAAGIVTEVVPGASLLEAAAALGARVLSKGPVAVRVARMATRLASESSSQASLMAESLGLALLYGTEDKAEGTKAFIEKRTPSFTGK